MNAKDIERLIRDYAHALNKGSADKMDPDSLNITIKRHPGHDPSWALMYRTQHQYITLFASPSLLALALDIKTWIHHKTTK